MKVETVREAVAGSVSYAGTLRALGLSASTYNYDELKAFCARHGIKTDHFKGSGWRKGIKRFGETND